MSKQNTIPVSAEKQPVSCQCSGSCKTDCKPAVSGSCTDCSCANGKPGNCGTCGSALKSGMKYENICTSCQPIYLGRCSGCQRLLWDCMCIRPHTWE